MFNLIDAAENYIEKHAKNEFEVAMMLFPIFCILGIVLLAGAVVLVFCLYIVLEGSLLMKAILGIVFLALFSCSAYFWLRKDKK
jgi:hypothetical protein